MVSIVIPCFNQQEYTEQCLEAIEAYTPEVHEIIFVDNGSTDGTNAWLKEQTARHANYTLITNPTNIGYPAACNQGVSFSSGEHVCLLNNDVVVSRDWLAGLMECLHSADDIGIVGPRTNYVSGPQVVTDPDTYDSLLKYQLYAESYRKAHRGLYTPFWRVVPICGLIHKDTWEKMDGFDERFSPGNFEDDDLCLRLCLAGYRNLICGDVFVHHHGSVTCKATGVFDLFEAQSLKYQEKWQNIRKDISAVMIVRDEEHCIGSCIASIYRHVDEIIVVDTGSKDATRRIAESAGAKVKVFDFEWCDDFSAARNFANSKATGAWLFSVDADEELEGLDKLDLRPFHCYRIKTRNYTRNPFFTSVTLNTEEDKRAQGIGWFPSTKIRIWPNDPRICFEYPVHEVVENSVYHLGMQIVEDDRVIVHHYGRMDEEYDDKHGEKYLHMLHKNFELGNRDLRCVEQLAIQAQGLRRYAEAKKYWREVLKIDPDGGLAPLNLCHCEAEEGNWREAKKWGEMAFRIAPNSRDAKVNLAACEFHLKNYKRAGKLVREVLARNALDPIAEGLLAAIEKRRKEKKR